MIDQRNIRPALAAAGINRYRKHEPIFLEGRAGRLIAHGSVMGRLLPALRGQFQALEIERCFHAGLRGRIVQTGDRAIRVTGRSGHERKSR